MLVRINGSILNLDPVENNAGTLDNNNFYIPCSNSVLERVIKECKEFFEYAGKMALKYSTYVYAGALVPPVGSTGLTEKLWPLLGRIQEFGLWASIAMGLWCCCRILMGDSGGKEMIWQTLLGFLGLFILPEIFLGIWKAFPH
ncbi:MAG: hypothetical protein ACOYJ1_11695 [Peptococcales bacterium]|jgi:hypothetical protein